MSEIFGYLIVEKDVDISTLPYENEEYTLLPGSIAYVVGGGAYMLTPSNRWQFLDPEIQKIVLPVFKNVSSSGGGGGSSGGGGLIVNAVYDEQTDTTTLDKTWNEIKNAVESGGTVYIYYYVDETEYGYQIVTSIQANQGSYDVNVTYSSYTASSADSYPENIGTE